MRKPKNLRCDKRILKDFCRKTWVILYQNIPCLFLQLLIYLMTSLKDVNFWASDESYNECVKFFDKLTVVNDVAKRGVPLIEHYNKCFTKNEKQLQYLLFVKNW